MCWKLKIWDDFSRMCGKRRRALLVFLFPCAPTLHLPSVSNPWMEGNKTERKWNQISEKGFVFYLDWNKSRKQRVLHFSVLVFLPYAADKQNPALTSCCLTLYQSGGRTAKNWQPVFFGGFFFIIIIIILKSHPWVLSQTLWFHLPGIPAGQERRLKSCFFGFSRGTKDASQPLRVGSEQKRSHRPVKFACFVSIDCTDFFSMLSVLFLFYSDK